MSALKATEAAVAAVQQSLGCGLDQCINTNCTCRDEAQVCIKHDEFWTERGCPVAVAAADAAAPHTAAQTLRDAADEADSVGHHWSGAPALAFFALAGDYRDRADRIEADQ